MQRHTTKVISCVLELSYPFRLLKLNLLALVYRRNGENVILANKVLRANTLPALFPTVGTNSRTRGHHLKLVKQCTISRVYTQFFSSCIVNNWNILSNELVTAEFVFVFSNKG